MREQPGIYDIEEVGSIADRIMPFEFLYLLQNAKPRMEIMECMKPPSIEVEKIKISDFFEGEERRQDLE